MSHIYEVLINSSVPKDMFLCAFCDTAYFEISEFRKCLAKHERQVTENIQWIKSLPTNEPKAFICRLCNQTFPNRQNLNLHIKDDHFKRRVPNTPAPKPPAPKTYMKKKSQDEGQINSISMVAKVVTEVPEQKTDQKSLIQGKDFLWNCKRCGKNFARRMNAVNHLKQDHQVIGNFSAYFETIYIKSQQLRYKCSHCNKLHPTYELYKVCFNVCSYRARCKRPHDKTPGPYICDFCDKTFSKRSNFVLHHKQRHTVDPVECRHCFVKFKNKYLLETHQLLNCIKQPTRSQYCSICKKYFVDLKQHFGTDHPQKPTHLCSSCGKGLPTTTSLHMHSWSCKNRHFDELSSQTVYQFPKKTCPICEKFEFFTYTEYYKHKKTEHSLVKSVRKFDKIFTNNYECIACGKCFGNGSRLMAHELTHRTKRTKVSSLPKNKKQNESKER